jgi:hypothetical protein
MYDSDRGPLRFKDEPSQRVWPKALLVAGINVALAAIALLVAQKIPQSLGTLGVYILYLLYLFFLAPLGEFAVGIYLYLARSPKWRPLGLPLALGVLLSAALGLLVMTGICLLSMGYSGPH